MTPYEVLGVPNGTSVEDCKKAYRSLSKKYHPDSPSGDHDKFEEIAKAYEMIKSGQAFVGVVSKGFLKHMSLFNYKVQK